MSRLNKPKAVWLLLCKDKPLSLNISIITSGRRAYSHFSYIKSGHGNILHSCEFKKKKTKPVMQGNRKCGFEISSRHKLWMGTQKASLYLSLQNHSVVVAGWANASNSETISEFCLRFWSPPAGWSHKPHITPSLSQLVKQSGLWLPCMGALTSSTLHLSQSLVKRSCICKTYC